jgi:hypothetical protein
MTIWLLLDPVPNVSGGEAMEDTGAMEAMAVTEAMVDTAAMAVMVAMEATEAGAEDGAATEAMEDGAAADGVDGVDEEVGVGANK